MEGLTKLTFDGDCEFYSLRVPKGFDVTKLKNFEINRGVTEYETGIEISCVTESSAQVILDPTDGNLIAAPIKAEIAVSESAPKRNHRFKFIPPPEIPIVEATANRSQLALCGLIDRGVKKEKKRKKKKRKRDQEGVNHVDEPSVKLERHN